MMTSHEPFLGAILSVLHVTTLLRAVLLVAMEFAEQQERAIRLEHTCINAPSSLVAAASGVFSILVDLNSSILDHL